MCGLYPLWWLLTPADAYDPWWIWAVIGLFCAAAGLASVWLPAASALARRRLFGFAIAPHLHWLLALNPDQAFYLGAAGGATFTSALVLTSWVPLALFSSAVMVLATGLALMEASLAYYPAAIASGLGLANLRLLGATASQRRAAHREATLVTKVAEQRKDLAQFNESLEAEKARRKRLQEELEVSQRMESVGRLAGGLAHDFNNELMTIRLYADLLAAEIPDDDKAQEDLHAIQRATKQASNLTRKLLTIGRSDSREGSGCVAEAVRDNIEILSHLMGENVEVRTVVGAPSAAVPVGGDQLERILMNLVINAWDAMPDGGVLTIHVDQLDPQEAADADLPGGAGEVVRLAVSDTGAGIPEAVRSRIFDPYFTTKETSERNGLGLSVVYSIVAESGGRIRVFSEPGQGTRFELLWPRVEMEAPVRPRVEASNAEPRRLHGTRVLLVEDEPDVRAGLSRWLREAGCYVIDAATAEDALAIATREAFDVLATDVVLPGLSGTELVARLREARPTLRVLVFSGNTERRFGVRARALPKDATFLRKPFGASDLIDAIGG